jgi:hypothetical protein
MKRPYDRTKHKWVDNIKMDFQVRSREGVVWIHPTRNRENWWALLSSVIKFRVP